MICRICKGTNLEVFLDLGLSPIANDFLIDAEGPDPKYPLETKVCMDCSLVQLPEISSREHLFAEDYVYFSSFSKTWLEHSKNYAQKMITELELDGNSLVVEAASNDGYLLQFFSEEGVPVLGVEPSDGVARVARDERKIPTITAFFGELTATSILEKYGHADLVVANNVLAHVPDLHDFVSGFQILLSESGVITFEFPHILNLIRNNQFDTIYHEHYSYLGVCALQELFSQHQLKIYKIDNLETHGGSIRIYVVHAGNRIDTHSSVEATIKSEMEFDPRSDKVRKDLQSYVSAVKDDLIKVLAKAKEEGKKIAGYGAAAKGNTLLNYAGVDSQQLEYVVDLNPNKQNKYLPGSRIRVVDEKYLTECPPDILLILPWNLADEIIPQVRSYGLTTTKFLRAVPKVEFIQ